MADSRIHGLYTSSANGLAKADDTFTRTVVGEQFSRLVKGLDPLIERADIIKMHSADQIVYGRDLKPTIDEEGVKLGFDGKEYKLTEWSLGQFSQLLKIPSSYAHEMLRAGKHKLFLENFESWMATHALGKQFLARTFDDKLRGVLSERYQPIDADYMLPRLREKLASTGHQFYVDKAILNPEYTNIRIISNQRFDVGGDPHYVAIVYSSSDVGRASFHCELFFFRSRCTNGMFFGKQHSNLINHTHTTREFMKDGYFEKELDKVLGSMDTFANTAGKALTASLEVSLDEAAVRRIVEQFQSRTSFTKKSIDSIREELLLVSSEYAEKPTLWSVTNAFTQMAQGQTDVAKAEEMERFAGTLLLGNAQVA